MTKLNRFVNGSAVYKCAECGKMTRATSPEEQMSGFCHKCYLLAELENGYADGDYSPDEYEDLKARIEAGEE
jgi:hypothetical protein